MLTAIKGIYEDGKIVLAEQPAIQTKAEVIVTFLTEETTWFPKKRTPGGLKNKLALPDDFNEPLADLKDYM